MDDFRLIYRILRILQKSMDLEEFSSDLISAKALGLSEPKWSRIMAMLLLNDTPFSAIRSTGLGIKAHKEALNQDRVDGILNKV